MNKRLLPFLCCVLLLPAGLCAQTEITAEQEAFFNKLMQGIHVRHVKWVNDRAGEMNKNKLTEQEIRTRATGYGVLGSLNNQDIEALVFLVMMQAAKSAQEDLKAIMARVKSINRQKEKQRELLSQWQQQKTSTASQLDTFHTLQRKTIALQQGGSPDSIRAVRFSGRNKPLTKAAMDGMKDKLKNDLAAMNEMGEMESLRLQMAMDRMSKMMTTLSNILKKISDSAQTIIQNLK